MASTWNGSNMWSGPSGSSRPTLGLIGRVVPIKDIVTCIRAAAHVRDAVPDAEVLIIGPTDEDPQYFEDCKALVEELGLGDTVRFTGRMNILDALAQLDVVLLSSISEAQPLVLLEAGAAGLPCVTTDVGSCREIIVGPDGEVPHLGRAGFVAPPNGCTSVGCGCNIAPVGSWSAGATVVRPCAPVCGRVSPLKRPRQLMPDCIRNWPHERGF